VSSEGFARPWRLVPAACNRAITSDQHDPSANRPCTRTTLRALTGAGIACQAAGGDQRYAAACNQSGRESTPVHHHDLSSLFGMNSWPSFSGASTGTTHRRSANAVLRSRTIGQIDVARRTESGVMLGYAFRKVWTWLKKELVVLKQGAVAGIGIEDQLSVAQTLEHSVGVDCWQHSVVAAADHGGRAGR